MMKQEELLELLYQEVKGIREDIGEVNKRLDSHEVRLENIESKLDSHEARLESIEDRLDRYEARLESIESKLDRHEARLENIESKLESHEAQLDALWAQAAKNFETLERDLGGAMEGVIWLKDHKVDKKALRQAAI